MDVLVIGCGVSGLTTGLRLLDAGHAVTIWARERPPYTTSNIAAAVWYPYKAYPEERVTAWGAVAYQRFKALCADPQTGVRMAYTLEALAESGADPWWVSAVEGFRHARADELPPGYQDGYVIDAPVIDTGIYLNYLVRMFEARGGRIVERTVGDLSEAFALTPMVVNCAGLGARELVGDRDLHPSRGQVLRVKANGFRQVVMDDVGPNAVAYVVPRVNDIVLGGTDDEGNWSTEPDPEVTAGILRRTAKLVPWAASVTPDDIVNVVCGLRPVRSEVRLEAEHPAPGRTLVHNYGHGGAGITLSWGCAEEAAGLVESAAR